MASIDLFLLGYRTVVPEAGSEARLATALISLEIGARTTKDGKFLVRESDIPRLRAYVGGRVRCDFGELMGLPGAIKRQRYYILPFISFILSFILTVYLSTVVWDVRISTDGDVDIEAVRQTLSDLGLSVGVPIGEIDIEHTENALLLSCDEIAFVQINRSGTVMYVELREKAGIGGSVSLAPLCSNIIAAKDGVIEEITVRSGVAVVRPGDTVKAGDILISGIVANEAGIRFERAEGDVIAHTRDSISASAALTEVTSSLEMGDLVSLSVVILGKTINIFKNYGNLGDECVIIEDEEVYTVGDGKRLPLSLRREYIGYRVSSETSNESADLPAIAGERLSEMLATELIGADLIKLRTRGEYTEGGYVLTAEFVRAENICREVSVDLGG